jgi:hypothetical protein
MYLSPGRRRWLRFRCYVLHWHQARPWCWFCGRGNVALRVGLLEAQVRELQVTRCRESREASQLNALAQHVIDVAAAEGQLEEGK